MNPQIKSWTISLHHSPHLLDSTTLTRVYQDQEETISSTTITDKTGIDRTTTQILCTISKITTSEHSTTFKEDSRGTSTLTQTTAAIEDTKDHSHPHSININNNKSILNSNNTATSSPEAKDQTRSSTEETRAATTINVDKIYIILLKFKISHA